MFAGQCALSVMFVCVCTVRLAGRAQGVKIVLQSGEGGQAMPSLCLQGHFTRSDKSRIIPFKAS